MADVFLSKSCTGWLEFEADFAHVYITAKYSRKPKKVTGKRPVQR